MQRKPSIVFVFPGCMGGVSSFYFNIINNSSLLHRFDSHVILLQAREDLRPPFNDIFRADKVTTFHYSHKENQFYVQKRLNELIGNDDGLIVADTLLPLQAARRFDNVKTVYHLLHDHYYVDQILKYEELTDVAIAHSSFFNDAVSMESPAYFADRNFYIPYGVRQLDSFPKKGEVDKLKLVFLGRLADSKGVLKLNEIDNLLQAQGVFANWTIIGMGPLEGAIKEQWTSKNNVVFAQPETTDEVYSLLSMQDIFIFPTLFEGTPVSILECLANGVVTIVNDLPGGIRDIVDETVGFRCPLNDINAFVSAVKKLDSNRKLLRAMQHACYSLAQEKYDVSKNSDVYFECFEKFQNYKITPRTKRAEALKISRLDSQYIPNSVVKFIRGLRM